MPLTINSTLELTTGLTVASGAHVKVGINLPERDSDNAIITLGIYKDVQAYNENKDRILNVVNLPISFYAIPDENIINPVYVHQLAINHLVTNLAIDPTEIIML